MNRIIASTSAFMLAVALALGCGCTSGLHDDEGVAAKYDGGTIAEDEVTRYTDDYRRARGYESDETWAQHLFENGLTAKTWREQAIGSIVEERLELARAAELGITPDESRIEEQVASDRQNAGIDADDDDAWSSYLESLGMTDAEYRDNLEKASIEAQLLSREVTLDAESDDELISDYIEDNLRARVVRRYRVLCFDSAEAAQAAIDDMAGLEGDELAARFDSWIERDDSANTTSANGGDMGWDIANDLGATQQELNEEMVAEGALSQRVHESNGTFYVMLCTDYFVFESGVEYDDVPDEDLRAFLTQATLYTNWTQMTSDYIAGLREAAHVKVREMPEGLPYDVS